MACNLNAFIKFILNRTIYLTYDYTILLYSLLLTRLTGIESTQSTPQKPKTKFKLSSLPSSPSTDRYSPTRLRTNLFAPRKPANSYQDIDSQTSSSKVKSSILSEIDEFISNVKTIERINKGREYDASRKRLDVEDINKLIHKLEENKDKEPIPQKDENELGSRLKYIMYKDRDVRETCEEKINASPTLKKTQPSQKTVTTTDSYITQEVQSVTSSKDTQSAPVHYVKSAPEISDIPNERYTRENKVTLTYKRDAIENLPRSYAGETAKSSIPSIDSLKIFSLRDLWYQKEDDEFSSNERTRLLQKLEEEKLRRQVCLAILYKKNALKMSKQKITVQFSL